MNPQYIRIVLPSNKNLQIRVPSQQSSLQYSGFSATGQIRLVHPVTSISQLSFDSTSSQSAIMSNSSPASLDFNDQTKQKTCFIVAQPCSSQIPSILSSSVDNVGSKENIIQTNLISDIGKD